MCQCVVHVISVVGQWGEELPCVLWAAGGYERLGQTGTLPSGSRDLLLSKSSTAHISDQTSFHPWFWSRFSSVPFSVYLQGGACELNGKQDKHDFQLLLQCFETIGLHADQISTVWAILSSILHLGNICFSSYEVCACEFRWVSHIKRWCHTSVGLVSEWVFWGGSYLQRGRGQACRLIVTDFFWGPADRHHPQSHS